MAQLVCITKDTEKSGINEIDDIVAIHDDDVALTGTGYAGYRVIKVDGKTCAEVRSILSPKAPEQKRAVKVTSGKRCFMEEKEVWKNDKGEWCDLIARPKYSLSFKDVSELEVATLGDKEINVTAKDTILNKVVEKIHLDEENNVLVSDLNSTGEIIG